MFLCLFNFPVFHFSSNSSKAITYSNVSGRRCRIRYGSVVRPSARLPPSVFFFFSYLFVRIDSRTIRQRVPRSSCRFHIETKETVRTSGCPREIDADRTISSKRRFIGDVSIRYLSTKSRLSFRSRSV